jgi:chorismate dehydratase
VGARSTRSVVKESKRRSRRSEAGWKYGDLRVGCVGYLNARPLISGWLGPVAFDHPAVLSDCLQAGRLQVALVSSFEFLRNPIYRVVDGVSISSDGPVYSVVLCHRGELAAIKEIELDPASLTSVALLRCLLAQIQLNPVLVRASTLAPSDPGRATLLIGDQAIRFREKHENDYAFGDLGEWWKKLFALPFVYALWLIRPELPQAKAVAEEVRRVRDANLANIGNLIAQEKEFEPDFCRFYYEQCVRFDFGDVEKEGLKKFASLCEKHKILPRAPDQMRMV